MISIAHDSSLISYRSQKRPVCPHNGWEPHLNCDDCVDHPLTQHNTDPCCGVWVKTPLQYLLLSYLHKNMHYPSHLPHVPMMQKETDTKVDKKYQSVRHILGCICPSGLVPVTAILNWIIWLVIVSGNPWVFWEQPIPNPSKTHTPIKGMGFSQVRVWVLLGHAGMKTCMGWCNRWACKSLQLYTYWYKAYATVTVMDLADQRILDMSKCYGYNVVSEFDGSGWMRLQQPSRDRWRGGIKGALCIVQGRNKDKTKV